MVQETTAGIDAHLPSRIREWLKEDIGTGDITTLSTVSPNHQSKGIIHAKQDGILAGVPVASLVFHIVDEQLRVTPKADDGRRVEGGTVLLEVEGATRSILQAERLALNLMQRLSGIATQTHRMVERLQGLPARLVDTRKTTPGHRALEKYAVRVGGGYNHRFGLYDAVMIKDNHIKAAGGVRSAVAAARERIPHTMKIEVEAEQQEEWEAALEAGADIIMLDNCALDEMKRAVNMMKQKAPHVIVEASGGISLETVRDVAETGVDVISSGSMTSSVQTLDISLDLNEKKGSVSHDTGH